MAKYHLTSRSSDILRSFGEQIIHQREREIMRSALFAAQSRRRR
ncbi:hypothetical protein CIT292_06975 [Citrobacter youngae ATCC 29220]|uniref:Uncharacterized protein n=1 Tax=Citrobacter youngae ATCC 29220 TaxID=500640 RepID=D4B937_9ENTR|nr:hypothetical protein CIT292_06975 [Citrobacter youngae ATCC 29220]